MTEPFIVCPVRPMRGGKTAKVRSMNLDLVVREFDQSKRKIFV